MQNIQLDGIKVFIPLLDAKGEKLKEIYWVDFVDKNMTQTSMLVDFDVPYPAVVERITYKNESIWFIMPKGQIEDSDRLVKQPVLATKHFSGSFKFDIGEYNTRFIRYVDGRLVIGQGDSLYHTKVWQLGEDYTNEFFDALN
jgi:hypothetical protein